MNQIPLRVIFVNRVYWPATAATAQLLTDLAEGLAAQGWEVHVLCAGHGPTDQNRVRIHRTGTPDPHDGLLGRALGYRRFLQAARRQLPMLIDPGDVVVALTDPPMLGAMVAETAAARGAKVIQWVQDIYPEIAAVHFGAIARWLLGSLARRRDRAWRAADACVALGDDMAKQIAARGVAADRIRHLPNWAPRELDELASPPSVAARRRDLGLGGELVVAYSGNLGRVHEFATLLAAAGQLRDAPIVFLFIGRGARFDAVAREVAQKQLSRVRLLPPQPREQLAATLAAADVHFVTLHPDYARLVYPSKLAGVLAVGRPVIFVGPADGDIARLLRERACGESFAPGDGAGLAATLRHWATDRREPAHLGVQAREVYAQSFRAETALRRWDELLREVHSRVKLGDDRLPAVPQTFPHR